MKTFICDYFGLLKICHVSCGFDLFRVLWLQSGIQQEIALFSQLNLIISVLDNLRDLLVLGVSQLIYRQLFVFNLFWSFGVRRESWEFYGLIIEAF